MINEIPEDIIKKYNIKLLILFGSTGTRYEREDSDLDLAFLTENILKGDKEFDLLSELIVFYKRDDIDLINLYKVEPGLKFAVSRKGRVIYQKNNAFTDFQLYAARMYADTKYLREEREKTLKERVAKL